MSIFGGDEEKIKKIWWHQIFQTSFLSIRNIFLQFFGVRNSVLFLNKIREKNIFSRNKMRQMQVQLRLENQYFPHKNSIFRYSSNTLKENPARVSRQTRENYHIICKVLGFGKIYNLWAVAVVRSLYRIKTSEIGLENYFWKSIINKLWTPI